MYRIGRKTVSPAWGQPSRPRLSVAKFTYFKDRERVRKSAKRLKGTNYGIKEQFPEEVEKRSSKKISNDQELIQSDPTSCPQNQKGNN